MSLLRQSFGLCIHWETNSWRENVYSDVYSPVLGPAIREAFGHLEMDMIIESDSNYDALEDCISGTSLKFLEENCGVKEKE